MPETLAAETTQVVEQAMAPLWLVGIMAPEVAEALGALGLDPTERYFPVRAAPLGAASLELVVATFFNFSPRAVQRAIPGVWEKATPSQLLAAQRAGVDRALRRAFASIDGAIVDEALGLLRAAAETASTHPEGRPLFAGYAALEWPDEPHLALWHAHYLLREYRGDGHIAVLVSEGLTGIEAFAIQVARDQMPEIIRQSRAWTDDEWNATVDDLRARGWLAGGDDLSLTEVGARRREAIEQRTNQLNLPAYAAIGEAGCDRLVELSDPISAALAAAGLALRLPPS